MLTCRDVSSGGAANAKRLWSLRGCGTRLQGGAAGAASGDPTAHTGGVVMPAAMDHDSPSC